MAAYVAIPYNVKLQASGYASAEQFLFVKTTHLPCRRTFRRGGCRANRFSQWKTCKLINPHLSIQAIPQEQDTTTISSLFSAVANGDGAIASDWIPFVDQVLLLASITLTYMAGVIPSEKPQYNTPASIPSDEVPENSSSGRVRTKDDEVSLQFAWDVVRLKLRDSLSTIKEVTNISGKVIQSGQDSTKLPSSLCAVAEGPRIRLLWASFQWLNKEVADISTSLSGMAVNDLRGVFDEIIRSCCRPLCMAWLKEELCLVFRKPDKELFSLVESKLFGYDSILQNIRKSGKENLYAELVYALKFGSSRKGGYYNNSLYIQHGVAILEDLIITLADGVASMYLELISVDSSLANEINHLGLSLCTLSTRALQRLRNEAALHQWLHQNMNAVISMYEDQFDLWTLQRQLIDVSSPSEVNNFVWWKRLVGNKSASRLTSLQFFVINQISVPVKRTKELRALNGWRYYFSLFLELSDIAMPFIRTVINKVSDAISFFLVSLIGRSLGLIYSGIRTSLRMR